MPDLTWDEMDFQDITDDAEFVVKCARCGKWLDVHADEAFLEEGDEWECELCNIRCDARDHWRSRGEEVDVDFDYEFPDGIAAQVAAAIKRYLLKG